jgi:hypothetical protein
VGGHARTARACPADTPMRGDTAEHSVRHAHSTHLPTLARCGEIVVALSACTEFTESECMLKGCLSQCWHGLEGARAARALLATSMSSYCTQQL